MMMSKNFSIFANKSENVRKCYAQKNQNNKGKHENLEGCKED